MSLDRLTVLLVALTASSNADSSYFFFVLKFGVSVYG